MIAEDREVLFTIYRLQPFFAAFKAENSLTDDQACEAMLELQQNGAATLTKVTDPSRPDEGPRFQYALTDHGKYQAALARQKGHA